MPTWRGRQRGRPLFSSRADWSRDQFSLELTLLNVLVSFVPSPCTTVMIATEMPAAINPYSIAVAPDSSCANRLIDLLICVPLLLPGSDKMQCADFGDPKIIGK